jgi:hypothetical protein
MEKPGEPLKTPSPSILIRISPLTGVMVDIQGMTPSDAFYLLHKAAQGILNPAKPGGDVAQLKGRM